MTRVEPLTKESEGEKLKAGMNQETSEERTIESDVAKPWRSH